MALQTKTFSYGSVTDKSVLNGYVLELTLTEQSVDTVKNTSRVDFVLKLRSGSKNRFEKYGLGASVSLNGKVVGTRDRYDEKQVSLGYNASVTLVSGSCTVAHSDDGSKKMAVAFSIDMATSNYVPGPVSVSGKKMALTVIPRASTIAASDANIGSVSTVVIGRKSTAYTHTVAVTFGSITGYLNADGELVAAAEKMTATTIPFAVPESFYGEIPQKASAKCTLTCTTYSDSAEIGTKTATFTVTADKSLCAPDVAISVKDVNTDIVALTGDENTLVRFLSTARCTVTATAKNGATVESLQVDGAAVREGVAEFIGVEKGSFMATCTDSRGYSANATATAELIPYVKLTCNASAKRLTPTDGTARLTVKGKCYNGSFGEQDNTLAVTYQVGAGEPVAVIPTVTENTYTAIADLSGLDYTQSFAITVTVTDAVCAVTKTVTLQPGVPIFDWGKEDFAFHVPVSINGVELDYIVEQGMKDGWTYRKWQSGIGECWKTVALTSTMDLEWGSMYCTTKIRRQDYPFVFIEIPAETATLLGDYYSAYLVCDNEAEGVNTVSKSARYGACRPTQGAMESTFYINLQVKGRWK